MSDKRSRKHSAEDECVSERNKERRMSEMLRKRWRGKSEEEDKRRKEQQKRDWQRAKEEKEGEARRVEGGC